MNPMNYALLPGSVQHSGRVYEYVRGLVSPNPCNGFYWGINEALGGRTPFQGFHFSVREQMLEGMR